MKILYIAGDRHDAQLAAFALRSVGPAVAVAWTSSLSTATKWLDETRTVAALIVEVASDYAECEAFIGHVRDLGVGAPIIVALSANTPLDSAPASLQLHADAVVQKNQAFLHDLPAVVTRALEARASQPVVEPLRVDPGAETLIIGPPREAFGDPDAQRLFAQAVRAREALDQRFIGTPEISEPASAERGPDPAMMAELERRLAEAEAAVREVEARAAARERNAESGDAERRREVEEELAREIDRRQALEAKLAEATLALERTEQRQAAAVREATARLAEDRQRAEERASQSAAALTALQAKLVDEAMALQRAEQQTAAERQAAAEDAARRQATIEAELTRETGHRQVAERALSSAEAVLAEARQRHASELSAATERLAEYQRQAERRLAEAGAAAAALEAKLAGLAAALEQANTRAAEDLREAREAIEAADLRQAAIDRLLADEAVKARTLESQLREVEANLRRVEESHVSAMSLAAARLEEQRAHSDERLAQASADVDALQTRLIEEAAALQRAEQQAASDRNAAAEQAVERQTNFEAELLREAGKRQALGRQLADVEAAYQQAQKRHAAELAAGTAQLLDNKKQSDAKVAAIAAAAAEDRQRAEDAHQAEIAALMTRLADQQAAADAKAIEHAAAIEAQALQHASAIDATAVEYASAIDAQAIEHAAAIDAQATEHASAIEAKDIAHAAAIEALQAQLAESAAELVRAGERAALDRQAAAQVAVERHATYSAELAQLVTAQRALEHELAEKEAAIQLAAERHAAELADAAARFDDHQQRAGAQLADLTADAAASLQAATAQAAAERQAAAALLAEREARFAADLGQEVARREALDREIAETRAASEHAQRRFLDGVGEMRERAREHEQRLEERAARERAQWEATLAERQEQIGLLQSEGDLARQTLAATEQQIERLVEAQNDERAALDRARLAVEADLAQQQAAHALLGRTLEETRTRSEQELARIGQELAAAREVIPQLRQQIDDIHADHRRQFDRSPVSMCQFRPDGTLLQVTQSLAHLLEYASPAELQKVDFAAAVFESGNELQWLIERCVVSGAPESIETTWARKSGQRVMVRLVAVAAAPDRIDLAVLDITTLRTLEDKLRDSQRLEAVARYASEVAVTCEHLLRDVTQEGQQWLAGIDSELARHKGEQLFGEVSRASGFLRQLAAYGDKQNHALGLADVNNVLRNLGSVLKLVAGDDIELVLPKGSKPLNLDIEAERIERIFVNVAAYARSRMPTGGRLLIEVDPVVLDRAFVEKYPSVRPGAHVLFTVTEARNAARPDWQTAAADAAASSPAGPGVDLGALQSLVSDSGGHLWIAAEPSGDMVLKIHLPRRAIDEPSPAKKTGRWINRLVSARH